MKLTSLIGVVLVGIGAYAVFHIGRDTQTLGLPAVRTTAARVAPAQTEAPVLVRTATIPVAIKSPVLPGKLFRTIESNWQQPVREESFARFKDWTERYLAAEPQSRAGLVAEGVALASARRAALRELMKADPERALELTVPSGLRKQLPAEVAALLESTISATGRLQVVGALAEPGRESEVQPVVRKATISGKEYETFTYGERLGVPTRNQIALSGIVVDNLFAWSENALRILDSDETEAALAQNADPICSVSQQAALPSQQVIAGELAGQNVFFCMPEHAQQANDRIVAASGGPPSPDGGTGGPQASAWTEGLKKLLIIRVDFTDVTNVSLSDIGCVNLINGLDSFYREMSFGRASFASNSLGSDFTPIFRMPQPGAYYGTNNYYDQLRSDARNAATAAGYTLANYDLDVICFGPVSGWGWAGLGYVGASGVWLRNSFSVGVAGHELGHNFGLNHANYWDTSGASVNGPGTSVEYGDIFDTMGSASAGNNHFNARNKNYLNWLTAADIVTATSNGTYRIACHDNTNSTGFRGLKITKSGVTNYWVEFRQKFTSNKWMMNGAGLRWGASGNAKSQLLDMTPGSTDTKNDSPLVIGRTYSDRESGIHITPVGKGGTSPETLDVVVNLGSFPANNAPTLAVTTSATNVGTGVAVTFNAAAADADGDALAYYWEFSESSSYSFGSNSPVAIKSWSSAGDYLVRCVVSDMKGGVASRWVIVRVGSPTTYRLTGNISDGIAPVAEARVSVSSTRMGYSDSDGNYAVVGLPAGSYSLAANLFGYAISPSNFTNAVSVGPDQGGLDFIATPVSTTPPGITTQPVSQTVNPGTSVTFSVVANGATPLSYQWRFNGANIAGATASSFSKSNIQAVDAGNYSVVVSNAYGTVTSANAVLSVNTPPVITVPPQSVSVVAGNTATFTVTASGSTPLAYQWRLNGTNISGASSSGYTRANVQGADAGNYSVVVTNALGAVTSSVASLTVTFSLTTAASSGGVVTRSLNQASYAPGTVVTLSATHPSFSFAGWSGSVTGLVNPIVVTLNSNLNITANFLSPVPDLIVDNPQAAFAGTWSTGTSATDKYGSDYRTVGSVSGSATATATFTPNFSTTGFYDVYVWTPTFSRGSSATPVQIAGNGTNIALTINQSAGSAGWLLIASNVPFAQGTNGFVRFANNTGLTGNKDVGADAVRWAYSLMQNTTPPVIVSQPTNVTTVAGANVGFAVALTGSGPMTCQWRRNGVNLAGATNDLLSLPAVQSGDAGNYSIVAANAVGSVTSVVATLTVLLPPAIVAAPTNQTVLAGAPVTFAATASGSGNLFYQWRRDGAPIAGATASSYFIASAQAAHAGIYDVVVTNTVGSILSSGATLKVSVPPQLSTVQLQAGGVDFQLAGTIGDRYVVESSEDFVTWLDVATLTNLTGSVQFSEPVSAALPRKFYRGRLQP